PSCRQNARGASRSERLMTSQHVPDGLRQLAGDVHGGHLAAALAAEAMLDGLIAGLIPRRPGGMLGGFNQRPAQVPGPVLGQGAAVVPLARLADKGAETGVANQFGGRSEAADVADLGGDGVG